MISPTLDRVEWLRARQLGITATDIAAIVGLDPYRTPLQVWLDKTVPIDDELDADDDTDVEAMEWGHRLEPMVAAKFADKHPEFTVHDSPGLVAAVDPGPSWALATPDRLLTRAAVGAALNADPRSRLAVLELKTAGARQARAWENDDTPAQYVVQVQWQLLVCGFDVGFIGALIAGQKYVERRFKRDEQLIDMLVEKGSAFLSDHVQQHMPPQADPWRDSRLLSHVYDVTPAERVQLSAEALTALDLRRHCKAQIEGLEHEIAEAEAIVKQELGGAEIGLDGDRVAITWKQSHPKRLDQKALKREHPELVKTFSPPGERRTFLPKEIKTDE